MRPCGIWIYIQNPWNFSGRCFFLAEKLRDKIKGNRERMIVKRSYLTMCLQNVFFELRCNGFSSQRFLCIGQSAYTDETMFFFPQRALMFHSSSTYHYLEQTWLYVFAVALERFNHLYGYREKSWTTLFPAGCPFLCCEFWLYACSTLLFHNSNWTSKRCRS